MTAVDTILSMSERDAKMLLCGLIGAVSVLAEADNGMRRKIAMRLLLETADTGGLLKLQHIDNAEFDAREKARLKAEKRKVAIK